MRPKNGAGSWLPWEPWLTGRWPRPLLAGTAASTPRRTTTSEVAPSASLRPLLLPVPTLTAVPLSVTTRSTAAVGPAGRSGTTTPRAFQKRPARKPDAARRVYVLDHYRNLFA